MGVNYGAKGGSLKFGVQSSRFRVCRALSLPPTRRPLPRQAGGVEVWFIILSLFIIFCIFENPINKENTDAGIPTC